MKAVPREDNRRYDMNRIFKQKGFRFVLVALVGIWLGLASWRAFGAEGPAGFSARGEPIRIASDRMVADQNSKTVIFEGHVTVQQGDMTITGRRLTVYADKSGDLSENGMMEKIDRIEITGDVRISQQGRIATAHKAVLYMREQKVVLMGDPMLAQGKDRVRGKLITLYLRERRSVVEGGADQPVQAVFHPRRREKKAQE